MQVGRRVAALRAAHGESLRMAAARTGVSHTTIARIENGKITRSMHSTLCKIAEGYRVPAEYLVTELTSTNDLAPPLSETVPVPLEETAAVSELSIYAGLMRKAIKAGIEFEVLDLAIDILRRQGGGVKNGICV